MNENQTAHHEGHLLEHGLWCAHCLLPSAYRVAIVRSETLRRLTAFTCCDECGHREPEARR